MQRKHSHAVGTMGSVIRENLYVSQNGIKVRITCSSDSLDMVGQCVNGQITYVDGKIENLTGQDFRLWVKPSGEIKFLLGNVGGWISRSWHDLEYTQGHIDNGVKMRYDKMIIQEVRQIRESGDKCAALNKLLDTLIEIESAKAGVIDTQLKWVKRMLNDSKVTKLEEHLRDGGEKPVFYDRLEDGQPYE